jgi:hypothetical protein
MKWGLSPKIVMPGQLPGIHVLTPGCKKMWMAGTSRAKTRFALLPGHDERANRFQAVSESLEMPAAFPVRL